MRATLVCAVTVAGFLLMAAGGLAHAGIGAGACPTSAGMKDASKKTKASSFAPHPRPPNNAYGQPIGGKILSRRLKKKPATPSAPAA